MKELLRKYKKNELDTCFEQNFTTGSYRVRIGHAWCSWKACEICSSLVQKKKSKKNKNSSHKLPKLHSTSFWSQGISGVNTLKFFETKILAFSCLEKLKVEKSNKTKIQIEKQLLLLPIYLLLIHLKKLHE
jgi:hypothetical protein